jgi:hypothetical protein
LAPPVSGLRAYTRVFIVREIKEFLDMKAMWERLGRAPDPAVGRALDLAQRNAFSVCIHCTAWESIVIVNRVGKRMYSYIHRKTLHNTYAHILFLKICLALQIVLVTGFYLLPIQKTYSSRDTFITIVCNLITINNEQ